MGCTTNSEELVSMGPTVGRFFVVNMLSFWRNAFCRRAGGGPLTPFRLSCFRFRMLVCSKYMLLSRAGNFLLCSNSEELASMYGKGVFKPTS